MSLSELTDTTEELNDCLILPLLSAVLKPPTDCLLEFESLLEVSAFFGEQVSLLLAVIELLAHLMSTIEEMDNLLSSLT
jgi:hypothetical protein